MIGVIFACRIFNFFYYSEKNFWLMIRPTYAISLGIFFYFCKCQTSLALHIGLYAMIFITTIFSFESAIGAKPSSGIFLFATTV